MTPQITRRAILGALFAAPAIVKASSLMPLWVPRHVLYFDGVRDDADALQAWVDGRRVLLTDGRPVGRHIIGKTFRVSKTVNMTRGFGGAIMYCTITGPVDLPTFRFPGFDCGEPMEKQR